MEKSTQIFSKIKYQKEVVNVSVSVYYSFCLQKRGKLLSQALLEEYKYAVKEKKMSSLLLTIY